MKRLEILKGVAALSVLAIAYNSYFDLIDLPRREDLNLALSILCTLLFLAGLYHDHLSRKMLRSARKKGSRSFSVSRKGIRDQRFREGLLIFLFFIPVIPALLSFPSQPYLGLSLFLFPLHGIVRSYRAQKMKGAELIVAPDRIAFPLRSTRSVRFEDLDRVALKYEHLYFIFKDGKVETLPLNLLPPDKTVEQEALGFLGEQLQKAGVKGSEGIQELAFEANSRE